MKDTDGHEVLWFSALFTEVDGSAQPASFAIDPIGRNEVAALRIKASDSTGDMLIIEGRPERLLEVARELLRTAELVMNQTMQDPALRRLYGLTSVEGS
jgi:hypothetical protein